MNKRALAYLALASTTLAGAYLYVQLTQPQSAPVTAHEGAGAAQALESLTIVDGSLTTGSFNTKIANGQRIQFLVHTNVTDSLIVQGLDARIPLPSNQTTLISIAANTPGTHAIELDLSGTTIGAIEVTP